MSVRGRPMAYREIRKTTERGLTTGAFVVAVVIDDGRAPTLVTHPADPTVGGATP